MQVVMEGGVYNVTWRGLKFSEMGRDGKRPIKGDVIMDDN